MDVNDLLENFKVELTCPICLCYFKEPGTLPCGHSFCMQCLLQYWEEQDETFLCPECRSVMTSIDVVSNKNLKKLCTIGKMLRSQFLQSLMGLTSCDQHREKEKLFCEEDQIALCESCSLSPEHKDHQILPLEMAAATCKDKLETARNILKGKKKEFEIALGRVSEREKHCKDDIFILKRSVKSEYKKINDFLWTEEYLCLKTLEDESREHPTTLEESKAKIFQEIQNLDRMLLEVEDNLEKTILETLEEDMYSFKESLMNKYKIIHEFFWNEEYRHLETLDEEAKENLGKLKENKEQLFQQILNFQQMMLEVEENLEKSPTEMVQDMQMILERNEELLCEEPEIAFPKWTTSPIPGMSGMLLSFKRDVTLDPETANPPLTLSDNLKRVTYGNVPNNLDDNNERLDYAFTVLGSPLFTSGKHYWEVEVGDKKEWKVGICQDSVITKGQLSKVPEDGYILEAFKIENDFFVLKVLKRFRMSEYIQKLGVYLDYEWGHLAFYNAEDSSLIYSPLNMVFEGPLRPYFSFCLPNQKGVTESLIICPWSNQ